MKNKNGAFTFPNIIYSKIKNVFQTLTTTRNCNEISRNGILQVTLKRKISLKNNISNNFFLLKLTKLSNRNNRTE